MTRAFSIKGRQFFCSAVAVAMVGAALGLGSAARAQAQHAPPPGPDTPNAEGHAAPRLQNLGHYHHPISCTAEGAQEYFDQGLILAYGFNHAEAGRSFREVARLDPDCAIAYWGQALVLGPNINAPMDAAAEPEAYALIQKATAREAHTSQKERAYIAALAQRYSGAEKPDRQALDRAYADAMAELVKKYPDDLDAATLYAESLMDLRPWDYWMPDGYPYPETPVIIHTLEWVLARDPMHPGANHFYIHVMELPHPDQALASADRLRALVPGAGHLVHMPAHIYMRVGRYEDAVQANLRAIAADEDYITQCHAQGLYPMGYYPHNIHFLWWAASMEGRRQMALEAGQKLAAMIPTDAWHEVPALQQFMVTPLFGEVRFARWQEILAEPQPPADAPYWGAIWHFARGLAYAAIGKPDEAQAELDALNQAVHDPALNAAGLTFSTNTPEQLLAVGAEMLAGELAAKRGDFDGAFAHLQRGVLLQDDLVYNEPADWPLPVRQWLGAVLLETGRQAEAEAVYWEDLRRHRENGWSLFGALQALRAQGKTEEAAMVEKRFRKAWEHSDVTLTAARPLEPQESD